MERWRLVTRGPLLYGIGDRGHPCEGPGLSRRPPARLGRQPGASGGGVRTIHQRYVLAAGAPESVRPGGGSTRRNGFRGRLDGGPRPLFLECRIDAGRSLLAARRQDIGPAGILEPRVAERTIGHLRLARSRGTANPRGPTDPADA